MCGIFFNYHSKRSKDQDVLQCGYKLKHRGPTSSTVKQFDYNNGDLVTMVFHRLSIMGISDGDQPFFSDGVYVMCNGEIYNYKEIIDEYKLDVKTHSDCEVIFAYYKTIDASSDKHLKLTQFLSNLRGEFAFIIFDTRTNCIFAGRDRCGVRPLFFNYEFYSFTFASELKGIPGGKGTQIEPDKCHKFDINNSVFTSLNYFRLAPKLSYKDALIRAVDERLKSEAPIGFLLSGGFDSSIVLSIASELLPKDQVISVFTIGFSKDAPDVLNAIKVVSYLKEKYGQFRYIHYIHICDIKEGIRYIPDVIESLESFDTTTVRASTPMWIIAKFIRNNTSIKRVLSGEGSDELNGSYLYFHSAPDEKEFTEERIRLLNDIHYFDGLRADRTISAHGLELSTPFLDTSVIEAGLTPEIGKEMYKTMKESGMEKKLIRDMFVGYLPDEILYRTKEAFSDAVSYDWRKSIQRYAESKFKGKVTNESCPELDTKSPEENWYRLEFQRLYPNQSPKNSTPYFWLPKWVYLQNRDPSATVLDIHKEKVSQKN